MIYRRVFYLFLMFLPLSVVAERDLIVAPYSSYLYSKEVSKDGWSERRDILWPLISYRRYNNYKRFQFLNIVKINENVSKKGSDFHFYFFPFIFYGRVDKKPYFGLFPFNGKIREFLGYDYVNFILFPFFYEGTRANGRRKDKSYFWPFINISKSSRVNKWSIWPLLGRAESAERYRNYFFLWPFLNWGKSLNKKQPGSWYSLWPLYGRINNKNENSYSFLWPLFLIKNTAKEKRYNFPFPFLSYVRKYDSKNNLAIKKFNIWPLYLSYKRTNRVTSKTFLWPIINYKKHLLKDGSTSVAYSFVPLFSRNKNYQKGKVVKSHWKLWPLLDRKYEKKNTRYRFPAILPLSGPIFERNFSMLYLYERNVNDDGSYRTKMLWGMWKIAKDVKKKSKSWSFLWGLLGHKKLGDKRTLSLFWLNF